LLLEAEDLQHFWKPPPFFGALMSTQSCLNHFFGSWLLASILTAALFVFSHQAGIGVSRWIDIELALDLSFHSGVQIGVEWLGPPDFFLEGTKDLRRDAASCP